MNKSNDITILFQLVWNNIYIKINIFKHLKIFNLYYSYRLFNSYDQYNEFKYKYYLNEIEIGNLINDNINIELPLNIESIQINYDLIQNKSIINSLIIPSSIKSLKLINWPDDQLPYQYISTSNNNNINKLDIKFKKEKQVNKTGLGLYNNSLDAIKYSSNLIELNLYENIHLINKESFLSSTKLIKLNIINIINNHSPIEKGSLPQSLKELNIIGLDLLKFEPDYLPNQLIKLNLNITSGWFTITNGFKFPNTLKYFSVDCQSLNFDIPKHIETLNIRIAFYTNSTFNYIPIDSIYLKSLKINLKTFYNDNGESILPKYLNSLIVSSDFNERLKSNGLPTQLKYLEFNNNNSFLEILFPSDTGFNNGGYSLSNEPNIFPSSLTYLDMGDYFNQSIDINILPNNLKTLILGYRFNCDIIDGSIPFNLSLIVIKNPNYNKVFKRLLNPMTLVDCINYYNQYNQNELISFKYSLNQSNNQFNLSSAINLEYLDLINYKLNRALNELLPSNNIIKTLIISDTYNNIIKIQDFKCLEQIIIKGTNNGPTILTTTMTTTNPINNSQQQSNITYNFYNLKTIQINYNNTSFIDKLNPIFYQFIKLQNK